MTLNKSARCRRRPHRPSSRPIGIVSFPRSDRKSYDVSAHLDAMASSLSTSPPIAFATARAMALARSVLSSTAPTTSTRDARNWFSSSSDR
eukprot:29442-Pelagococcus_subviridis.AAC.3